MLRCRWSWMASSASTSLRCRLRLVSGDHVLDVLLGEVAAPLADVAAGHVGDRRPGDAAQVEGAVGVEAGVLDRQDGVADRHRHRRQRDHCAVLVAVEHGQDRPVGGADHRAGRRRGQQPAERMGVATDLKGGGRGHPSRRQHPGQGQAAQDHAGHHEQEEQPGQGPPPVGVWRCRWMEPAHRALRGASPGGSAGRVRAKVHPAPGTLLTEMRPPCASTSCLADRQAEPAAAAGPGPGRVQRGRSGRRPWRGARAAIPGPVSVTASPGPSSARQTATSDRCRPGRCT